MMKTNLKSPEESCAKKPPKELHKTLALITSGVGIWLIALVFTLSNSADSVGISDQVCGILLFVFGLLSLHFVKARWAVGVVGLWLQIAPLIFWAKTPLLYINDTLCGAIAIILCFAMTKPEEDATLTALPPGWSYNPSAWSHRLPTVALAMLCFFFSRYMAFFQLGYIDTIWDPFFPDGTLHVITSKISKSFPVSDAGAGALVYTLEALLGWQGGIKRWIQTPWLVLAFGFLVIPVGIVSITLIILQPVAVGSWCSWCLGTALCMLLMIVLTAPELLASLQLLRWAKKQGRPLAQVVWRGAHIPYDPRVTERPSLGFSLPSNLVLSALLGIWLMASPKVFDIQDPLSLCNFILGPIIVAVSIISCAEVLRKVRYLNSLFGIALILAAWVLPSSNFGGSWNNTICGILILLLCVRKGQVVGSYSFK